MNKQLTAKTPMHILNPFRYLIGFFMLSVILPQNQLSANDGGIGGNAGITLYLGNKTTRVGIFAGAYFYYDFVQINIGLRGYYNFKNFGPPGKYWEFNGYAGALLSYGKRDRIDNPFITSVSNQTGRRYSLAYSHNWYYNRIGTSQRTGTGALQFHKISIITENDLWGDNKDRFRTAAVTVRYRHEKTVLGVTVLLWTGEYRKRITDSDYPARKGYKEPERFGGYSHGILCVQGQRYLDYGQNVRIDAGIDAEQIRHVIQNRIMHDFAFLPENLVKKPGTHIPMLDTEGNQYLFLPGQKIKKASPYFNFAANPNLFY